MNQLFISTYYLLLAIAAILFIHDALFLFIRGKNHRPRQMLGVTTLLWGIMYLFMLIYYYNGTLHFPVLCGESLMSSHVFICLMFFFPLEVLRPGWINFKRIVCIFTPITLISAVYFIGMQLTGEHIEHFMTFKELFNNIGHFNVWYRFFMLLCNLILIHFLITLQTRHENKYKKWQQENFSDLDSIDITWITIYRKTIIFICLCYIVVAIWGSLISIMVHTLIMIISFSILFYKALFYENSYTDDLKVPAGSKAADEETSETIILNDKAITIANENSFESKLPAYVEKLKTWMEEEKPYLYKDFKLADVTRILPLNRSYLSRVFNEGFQQNFSEVIRTYRINYAKELMGLHPELPVYKVAETCGFSSDTTFCRVFQASTGVTPSLYKNQIRNL